MPIYEYECLDCQHRLEVMQKLKDPPPSCPQCGGKVKKLLSSPAVHFKGSGWYVTDYAAKGGAAKDGASKDGAKQDGGKGEAGGAEASSAGPAKAAAGAGEGGAAKPSTAKADTAKASTSGD